MPIDVELVRRIAALASVDLPDASLETWARQLAEIVDYVGLLSEADVPAAGADAASPGPPTRLRPDEPRPSLPVEDALRNAPERENGMFRVPRVPGA